MNKSSKNAQTDPQSFKDVFVDPIPHLVSLPSESPRCLQVFSFRHDHELMMFLGGSSVF